MVRHLVVVQFGAQPGYHRPNDYQPLLGLYPQATIPIADHCEKSPPKGMIFKNYCNIFSQRDTSMKEEFLFQIQQQQHTHTK